MSANWSAEKKNVCGLLSFHQAFFPRLHKKSNNCDQLLHNIDFFFFL